MNSYLRSHLTDQALLRQAGTHLDQNRTSMAELLADLGEIDARKLYLPAAHPSMHSFCVGEWKLSREAAFKRIRVARTARKFPRIFVALARGDLNLNAVLLLAPHLRAETADELLDAAVHKSRFEIERLLTERLSRPKLQENKPVAPPALPQGELAARPVDQVTPNEVEQPLPEPEPEITPHEVQRIPLRFTVSPETHERFHYLRGLLRHQVPSGDMAEVFDRCLRIAIRHLEKRKFAATDRPRPTQRSSSGRHIPAHVKRAVRERDGGQCTFVSQSGQRCPAQEFLEFDHIEEVARGGNATVANIRLRCHAHNQYEAERTFGAEFMENKRQAAAQAREKKQASAEGEARAKAAAERANELIPALRNLGFRAEEARRGAAHAETIPDAPLEARLRLALACLAPPHRKIKPTPEWDGDATQLVNGQGSASLSAAGG